MGIRFTISCLVALFGNFEIVELLFAEGPPSFPRKGRETILVNIRFLLPVVIVSKRGTALYSFYFQKYRLPCSAGGNQTTDQPDGGETASPAARKGQMNNNRAVSMK